MRSGTLRLTAYALIASFLFLPPVLSAKQRRGATLIVTRLDGRQYGGELIAVKPGSLLLLSGAGIDLSIDIADIRSVRIVRKSKAGRYSLIGGLAGFIGGAVFALASYDSLEGPFESRAQGAVLVGIVSGGLGALAGTIAGSALGTDSSFTIAGEPEAVVAGHLDKLRAYSREGRLRTGLRF
jgi:hypothetical protein